MPHALESLESLERIFFALQSLLVPLSWDEMRRLVSHDVSLFPSYWLVLEASDGMDNGQVYDHEL